MKSYSIVSVIAEDSCEAGGGELTLRHNLK